ncbi:MAG: AAA family ATPase [Bacteroidia bacterium]|nr:AAA family ATPase [Bacteroidia bacterium]
MKLSRIYIEEFNQFKDFDLDLRYPVDHPDPAKAGKPLEKICIIGQSGTGKTTLLELIWKYRPGASSDSPIQLPSITPTKGRIELSYEIGDIGGVIGQSPGKMVGAGYGGKKGSGVKLKLDDIDEKTRTNILYFPTQMASIIPDQKPQKPSGIPTFEEFVRDNRPKEDLGPKSFAFVVNQEGAVLVWAELMKGFRKYHDQQDFFLREIGRAASLGANGNEDFIQWQRRYEQWKKETPNPYVEIGEKFLDPLLKQFNLRIVKNPKWKTSEDLNVIQLETLGGKPISSPYLSSGAKNLILTSIPIFFLKPENAILLFDQPETSFYPDTQRKLVEAYQSMTVDSQLIFATHSPFLLSSFEPWEIVELKYNEETGYVYRELYHEKGRGQSVNDFEFNPQYLSWESIIHKVFDIYEEGNPLREEAKKRLAALGAELRLIAEKAEINSPRGKRKLEEYEELAEKLDIWSSTDPQNPYAQAR